MPLTQCTCGVLQPTESFEACPVHISKIVVDVPGRFGFGPCYGTSNLAHLPRSFNVPGLVNMLGRPFPIWDDYGVPPGCTSQDRWRPGQWYDVPAIGEAPRV